ncbi:MAG: iron-containing alcohol dehydrogenase [Pseudomonadota bacterium]
MDFGTCARLMADFRFSTVATIVSELSASTRLSEIITSSLASPVARPMIVTDQGLIAAGVIAPIIEGLQSSGFTVSIFDGVVADPPEHVIHRAVEVAKSQNADCIIGLGGGSSMDCAKLVALLAKTLQSLNEIYGIGHARGPRLPLIQIPTTAGTGSEVTPISIVTTGETTKMGVVSPVLYADVAVLDGLLTLSVPAPVTAATGIDAMVHAIEAITSRHLKNPYSDMLAMESLGRIAAHLLRCVRDGQDAEARQAVLYGAMLAGQAFANAPVGGVHALAYPLGGIYHLPHGLSNALMLLPVLRFNQAAAHDDYTRIAKTLGHNDIDTLLDWLTKFMGDLNVPLGLRRHGISHNQLPELADAAMLQTRLLGNNPRPISHADALALYEEAWEAA